MSKEKSKKDKVETKEERYERFSKELEKKRGCYKEWTKEDKKRHMWDKMS